MPIIPPWLDMPPSQTRKIDNGSRNISGLVEKNVTEPAANDHAKERAAGDEIANFRYRQIGVAAFRAARSKT